MKKILVATDFSSCARNATQYALELAQILKVEVCAIHAIGSTEGVNNSIYNAIYIEDYHNNKRQALNGWMSALASDYKDVVVSTACEIGSVVTVLTNYIAANEVELLVMGTMGSTGITSLFGSNTNTMIENTKIPTLIIPLESKYAQHPVITLATDFSSALSPEDVDGLKELITASKADKLNVLNVIEGADWKTNEAGEAGLKMLIDNTTIDFNYINESNPIEGIINFTVSNRTDILCLVKHHHNIVYRIFNKSTVNQLINKSIKAVLILHE